MCTGRHLGTESSCHLLQAPDSEPEKAVNFSSLSTGVYDPDTYLYQTLDLWSLWGLNKIF